MTRDLLSLFRSSLLLIVFILGAHTASAVWSNPPAGTPPACSDPAIPGCNSPLNTGNAFQYKTGAGLLVNDIDAGGFYSAYGLIVRYGKVGIGTISPTETLDIAGGNINIPTTSATAGAIKQGTNRFIHTYGTNNTFVGINAGNFTMTGGQNTAVGRDILANNTSGGFNAANGYQALYANTTGSRNTANGYSVLTSNSTGNENTASGYNSLRANTTGSSNTASGNSTLLSNTIGSYNTTYGVSSLYWNTTGGYNTANGVQALSSNTTGNNNTASGYRALYANTTGSYNTALGYLADVSTGALAKATAIGYNAKVSASNTMALGGMGVDAVSVVIGKTSATSGMTLDVNGQVQATAFLYSSDRNLKDNIRTLSSEESRKILDLSAVSFNWKDSGAPSIGIIAQDLERLYPELVATDKATGIKSVNYAALTPILLEVVKEQDEAIEELRQEVNALKAVQ